MLSGCFKTEKWQPPNTHTHTHTQTLTHTKMQADPSISGYTHITGRWLSSVTHGKKDRSIKRNNLAINGKFCYYLLALNVISKPV